MSRLTVASIKCECLVTMVLLFTESIDESGLTGSSIGQRQQADSGDAPKLAFRLRQIGGCLESRFIRKFRRAHLVYCPKERLLRQRNAIGRNDSRQARTWAPRFSRVPQNALAELQWICSAKVEFLTTVARAYMNGSFPGH